MSLKSVKDNIRSIYNTKEVFTSAQTFLAPQPNKNGLHFLDSSIYIAQHFNYCHFRHILVGNLASVDVIYC